MFISTVCTGTQNVERRVWKTSHFFDLQLFWLLPLRTSALVIVCNRKSGYHHVRCIVSCLLFESVCVAGWGIHLCRFKCRQSSQWRGIASQDFWSCVSMFLRVWLPIVLYDLQNFFRTGIVKVTVTPTWSIRYLHHRVRRFVTSNQCGWLCINVFLRLKMPSGNSFMSGFFRNGLVFFTGLYFCTAFIPTCGLCSSMQ